ncbi:MAG: hypothetical protein JSS53_02505, partial [Proteobacteria bacterium]|nr:hypothetical protein [Pseudomonadota bacterium]
MLKNQHTVQTDSEQELPLNEVIAAIKIPTFNLMHLKLPKSAFELCTDVLMDNLFKTKRITLSPPSADKTILGIENNDAWLLSY